MSTFFKENICFCQLKQIPGGPRARDDIAQPTSNTHKRSIKQSLLDLGTSIEIKAYIQNVTSDHAQMSSQLYIITSEKNVARYG